MIFGKQMMVPTEPENFLSGHYVSGVILISGVIFIRALCLWSYITWHLRIMNYYEFRHGHMISYFFSNP